ncbi:sphingosine 1-phosphate receptor 3-like [Callorhinchus milii]|uniref:Sphingosine-1-phosphate receptor 3a n=1 Tax=Callorhinchus milii TaxID=7868 RepID=A0A4W3GUW8_CALMI|nr:sphingosine 1-phosphate receptor 3-like [Callorhinchus milii]XP_042198578.1 sphingosine 1-phosphate receptor 3-like [Callorhinchus milii]|eukprot:gi/632962136/ref/XP_007897142.1/ PREDICTED: sphingosine 1-phosphate receptor 3-like [Callorhinchus milii]
MGLVNTLPLNDIIIRHYNFSGKLERRMEGSFVNVKVVIILLSCLLIVIENMMVLVAIWKNKKFHTRMYYFIGNLALSDLLAGVAYVVNIFLSGKNTLHLTPNLWFVREGSLFMALCASTFSLLAIAIERHMTMVKMRPYDAKRQYRLFLLLGACWIVSVILGILPIIGWNCIGSLHTCSTVLPLYSKSYLTFCITILTIILFAIVILYVRIYRLVNDSSRKVTSRKKVKSSHSERAMALLRTVVIVLGVFIACWAPLFIFLMLDVACSPQQCKLLYYAEWCVALAVLNSAINPIIYTLSSKEMRAAFFKLLCCCLGGTAASNFPLAPTVENSRSKSSGSHANKLRDEIDSPAILIPCKLVKPHDFPTQKGNL